MNHSVKSPFAGAADAIDPALVPQRALYTGASIPAIGLGTFGSDHADPKTIAAAVESAIEVGHRHLDCASVYGNEKHIGRVLERLFDRGLRRDELWITSKVWNDKHGAVEAACRESITDLRCEVPCLDAKPYIHESFLQTWRQMEELVHAGMVRRIGTSI
jgi:alcohol dehydrogenase (NADP+)